MAQLEAMGTLLPLKAREARSQGSRRETWQLCWNNAQGCTFEKAMHSHACPRFRTPEAMLVALSPFDP